MKSSRSGGIAPLVPNLGTNVLLPLSGIEPRSSSLQHGRFSISSTASVQVVTHIIITLHQSDSILTCRPKVPRRVSSVAHHNYLFIVRLISHFLKNSSTKFHETPSNSLFPDSLSHMDRHIHHMRCRFLCFLRNA